MDWKKIKDYVSANKRYIILAVVGACLFFWYQNGQGQERQAQQEAAIARKKPQTEESAGAQGAQKNSGTVTCDISGAVKKEGVYTLKSGARLDELIAAAGGIKSNAQLKAINRAVILKDQDKVHIPYKGERAAAATSVGGSSATGGNSAGESQSQKVNINTADKTELQKLTGIGEKKAERIIAYRKQKGGFNKIEDLKQVSGIGDKTFAGFKDQLTV